MLYCGLYRSIFNTQICLMQTHTHIYIYIYIQPCEKSAYMIMIIYIYIYLWRRGLFGQPLACVLSGGYVKQTVCSRVLHERGYSCGRSRPDQPDQAKPPSWSEHPHLADFFNFFLLTVTLRSVITVYRACTDKVSFQTYVSKELGYGVMCGYVLPVWALKARRKVNKTRRTVQTRQTFLEEAPQANLFLILRQIYAKASMAMYIYIF